LLPLVPGEHPAAFRHEVSVTERKELLERPRGWVTNAIPVEELVAGSAGSDEVGDVLDPVPRIAEALDRPSRDDVVDRNIEPGLVRLR
jgi:hypothetical protein